MDDRKSEDSDTKIVGVDLLTPLMERYGSNLPDDIFDAVQALQFGLNLGGHRGASAVWEAFRANHPVWRLPTWDELGASKLGAPS